MEARHGRFGPATTMQPAGERASPRPARDLQEDPGSAGSARCDRCQGPDRETEEARGRPQGWSRFLEREQASERPWLDSRRRFFQERGTWKRRQKLHHGWPPNHWLVRLYARENHQVVSKDTVPETAQHIIGIVDKFGNDPIRSSQALLGGKVQSVTPERDCLRPRQGPVRQEAQRDGHRCIGHDGGAAVRAGPEDARCGNREHM